MSLTHGTPVVLTDTTGRAVEGTLHLPSVWMFGRYGKYEIEQSTRGGYGVHTIRTKEGGLFRTEGRLSKALRKEES